MGLHYCCNGCDFQFFSGHSRHAGSSSVVCTSCTALFELVTESRRGPRHGERLPLKRVIRTQVKTGKRGKYHVEFRHEPTAIVVTALPESPSRSLIHYEFTGLRCPACLAPDTLVDHFKRDRRCPKCRDGVLDEDPIEC